MICAVVLIASFLGFIIAASHRYLPYFLRLCYRGMIITCLELSKGIGLLSESVRDVGAGGY
jgi:hypothetical protein